MTAPTPYLHFPGTAREALTFTAGPATLRTWSPASPQAVGSWTTCSPGPWGASDEQVIEPYGLHWLIGFEVDESA
ncbi:MAG: hypothetical protein ACXWDI_10775 [Nocardioides sp.]